MLVSHLFKSFLFSLVCLISLSAFSQPGQKTEFTLIGKGKHERISIIALNDAKVAGVVCYLTRKKITPAPKKSANKANAEVLCQDMSEVIVHQTLPSKEEAFKNTGDSFFKDNKIYRIVDKDVIIYQLVNKNTTKTLLVVNQPNRE